MVQLRALSTDGKIEKLPRVHEAHLSRARANLQRFQLALCKDGTLDGGPTSSGPLRFSNADYTLQRRLDIPGPSLSADVAVSVGVACDRQPVFTTVPM